MKPNLESVVDQSYLKLEDEVISHMNVDIFWKLSGIIWLIIKTPYLSKIATRESDKFH